MPRPFTRSVRFWAVAVLAERYEISMGPELGVRAISEHMQRSGIAMPKIAFASHGENLR